MSVRVLSLAKGKNNYVFRYTTGCEEQVVNEIMHLADDPDSGLDWLDAATLGFQIAHYSALACRNADKDGLPAGLAGPARPRGKG